MTASRILVAAATTLGLGCGLWASSQAHSDRPLQASVVEAPQCQPSDRTIQVTLDPPLFSPDAQLPWSQDSLTLRGIDLACIGHRYQLAVGDGQTWRPVRMGQITASEISVPLSPGDDTDHLAVAILAPGDSGLT